MKLLFLIKSLSVRGGGAERVLADVTSRLAARAHDVTVASFDRPGENDFYRVDPTVRRVRLGIGERGRPAKALETLRRMRRVRRLARDLKPDVAVGFMHSTYIPQSLALAGTGTPLLASEHIVFDHYKTVPLQSILLRASPLLVDGITVISEQVKASFPLPMQRLMTVIPNPVSVAPARLADPVGGRRKMVITAGRLVEQKDHAVLIAAFALIAPKHPDWSLKILGEGPLRPQLELQIESLGIGGRVTLPGTTPEIEREYLSAQVFAMPSRYESFGLVTAEALAHGLPVVGFANCPGTNELIINGRNGLLIGGEEDRAVALAAGLDRLMSSEQLRREFAAAGPVSVRQYSLDAVVDRWEALLRSLVRRRTEVFRHSATRLSVARDEDKVRAGERGSAADRPKHRDSQPGREKI